MREIDRFAGFRRGMGIGGWLTNYKRFNVLPEAWRHPITVGDMEHFESYITEEDIRRIASWGMDHVRLGFDQIVLESAPGVPREPLFRKIDEFLGWCRKYRLNAVLNLHKAIANYCDIAEPVTLLEDAALQERFINLWLEIERRWHQADSVAFELLNEVRDVPPEQWNNLAQRTVAAIRRANPERRIIVGSIRWNSPETLSALPQFDDPAVACTFHCYEPFEFTHQQGVLQPGPLYYNRKMCYPGDAAPYREYRALVDGNPARYDGFDRIDRAYLEHLLEPVFEFQRQRPETPLWCGEFGTIRHCRLEYRENWMNDLIGLLEEHGIPWCAWNYLSTPNDGNRFSLVDDDSREILSPRLAEILQGKTTRR